MVDSFKNFERLRYRLSSDISQIADDLEANSSDTKKSLVNTIFATVFSGCITEVAFMSSTPQPLWSEIVKRVVAFVAIYIVAYGFYMALVPLVHRFFDLFNRKKTHAKKRNEVDQCIKEFDNIACDSVLLARGYMDDLSETNDQLLKKFYYYEIMHYLRTANVKILTLLVNEEKCIKKPNMNKGVEIYRIDNILSIEEKIFDFLMDTYTSLFSDYVSTEDPIICTIDSRLNTIKKEMSDNRTSFETIRNSIKK